MYESFDDFVVQTDSGFKLKENRITQIKKQLFAIENSEQYILIAKNDGFFLCKHCYRGSFYLKAGEIWKIGTTSWGKQYRYPKDELTRLDLIYVMEYKGPLMDCLKREKIRIAKYPLLEENTSRPPFGENKERYRLARPPGNFKDN